MNEATLILNNLLDRVNEVISVIQDSDTEVALDHLFDMRDTLQEMVQDTEIDSEWTDEERRILSEIGVQVLEDIE